MKSKFLTVLRIALVTFAVTLVAGMTTAIVGGVSEAKLENKYGYKSYNAKYKTERIAEYEKLKEEG